MIEADIPGLRALSRDVGTARDDVAAVLRAIGNVPEPTTAGYGWEPAAAAMSRVLSAWSTEVDLLREVCSHMRRSAHGAADHLQELDDSINGRWDGYGARPV